MNYSIKRLLSTLSERNQLTLHGENRGSFDSNIFHNLAFWAYSSFLGRNFILRVRFKGVEDIIRNAICLNTNFRKREGKLWTYTYANNTKEQIDYVFINKKWNNSALNCRANSSFECVSSDHRIITANIRVRLRKNSTRTTTTVHYD